MDLCGSREPRATSSSTGPTPQSRAGQRVKQPGTASSGTYRKPVFSGFDSVQASFATSLLARCPRRSADDEAPHLGLQLSSQGERAAERFTDQSPPEGFVRAMGSISARKSRRWRAPRSRRGRSEPCRREGTRRRAESRARNPASRAHAKRRASYERRRPRRGGLRPDDDRQAAELGRSRTSMGRVNASMSACRTRRAMVTTRYHWAPVQRFK